jgi:NAD(P)-dependent dehydrogenase (short-subunit alcohol dehydrogenase family)
MRTLKDLMDLNGRVAIVTGGAGNIGSAMAEALLELNARVIVHDVSEEACRSVVEGFQSRGFPQAESRIADLADEEQTRALVRSCAADYGRLDILIHSAAFVDTTRFPGWAEPITKQSVQAWDAALRVNVTAAFVMVQEAIPLLKASGHGSVIFIASIYGLVAPDMSLYEGTSMQKPAAYCASKGGLLQLMRYFATILAPRVRVNAITPGGVWRNQPEVFCERYKKKTPLDRMAVEEDYKGAAAYLASDLSAYVTGHNLVVDGGWTAW